METWEVKRSIEAQLNRPGNYLLHNSLRICKNALFLEGLTKAQKEEINRIQNLLNKAVDPWQFSGYPNMKAANIILEYLNSLNCVL